MSGDADTLVLDVGKSNAKLVLIGRHGEVLGSMRTANESVPAPAHGFLALGTARLADWLRSGIPDLLHGRAPRRLAITTHGAAFCALDEEGLVLPPIDYEWNGYGEVTGTFDASLVNFAHHGTPRLPQGLNGGRQIDYVQRRWPGLAARIHCWLPYAQYWAWWFSGVACSEVSSLGCHTGLWAPAEGRFSDWALSSGVAARFAPMRRAWDVVGSLRPALAQGWGLPAGVEVLAGVHDSNACLARHLRAHPQATVVSTGTWCVVMAPGADISGLSSQRDKLVNVAVDGRAVPTARFMAGRVFAAMCGAASAELATADALSALVADGWMALPEVDTDGRPRLDQPGAVLRHGIPLAGGAAALPDPLRPALAAQYCAHVSARLIVDLVGPASEAGPAPVILEGPLAQSAAYVLALAAALAPRPVLRSVDALEGTARGAWLLAHWQDEAGALGDAPLLPVQVPRWADQPAGRAHARLWGEVLASAGASGADPGPLPRGSG